MLTCRAPLDHQEKKRRTNKAKANKDRKRKPESDSDSDTSSGEDDDEDEDDDLHLATGVDFSKKLPYEIVAEVKRRVDLVSKRALSS